MNKKLRQSKRSIYMGNPLKKNLKLAKRLIDQGNSQEALLPLKRLLEDQPDDPRNHLLLANTLSELGRYDEAEMHYGKALKAKPERVAFHAFYGLCLLDEGKIEAAEKAIAKAVKLAPENALSQMISGLIHLDRGRLAKACAKIDHFGEAGDQAFASRLLAAIESRPEMADLYHPRWSDSDKQKAVPELPPDSDLKYNPDKPTPLKSRRAYHAALSLRNEGRIGPALTKLYAVLESVPREPETLLAIAETFFLIGRNDQAKEALRRLPEEVKNESAARSLSGLILFAEGEKGLAGPLIAEAVKRDVEIAANDEIIDLAADSLTYYYAGKLALDRGDRLAARRYFWKIPPLDPLLINDRWEQFKTVNSYKP